MSPSFSCGQLHISLGRLSEWGVWSKSLSDACQQEKVEILRLGQSMLETIRTEEEGLSGNESYGQNFQGAGDELHKLQGPLWK